MKVDLSTPTSKTPNHHSEESGEDEGIADERAAVDDDEKEEFAAGFAAGEVRVSKGSESPLETQSDRIADFEAELDKTRQSETLLKEMHAKELAEA